MSPPRRQQSQQQSSSEQSDSSNSRTYYPRKCKKAQTYQLDDEEISFEFNELMNLINVDDDQLRPERCKINQISGPTR